jgi:hypothetical protein
MKKELHPGVVVAVIVAAVLLIGGFAYFRANAGPDHAVKPQDMLKDAKLREAIGSRFRESQRQGAQGAGQ